MKYQVISTRDLLVLSLLMSILTATLLSINSWFSLWIQLPVVHTDQAGACLKVDNYVNGQAYNCQDVGVLLRQYRKSTE